jgi:hypothetical protein
MGRYSMTPVVSGLSKVFDSGAQLEQLSLQLLPDVFNSEGTNATFDGRSDNKGEATAAAAAAVHCTSA